MERGAGGEAGTARTATNKIPASPALGPPTEAERNPSSLPPPFCSIISARVMPGVDAGVDEEEGAPKIGSRWARTVSSLAYLWDHERWENTPSRFPMAQNTVASEVGDCSCPLSSCTYLQCKLLHLNPAKPARRRKRRRRTTTTPRLERKTTTRRQIVRGARAGAGPAPRRAPRPLLLAECARETHLWTHTGVTESVGPAKMVCARLTVFLVSCVKM